MGPLRMFILAALLGLAATASAVAQNSEAQPQARSERDILKSLKIPDGYEATVFANAPRLGYPVACAAAIDGTLFVAVDENGSIDRKPDRGKIVRLRDTDGDGKADEFKLFAKMDSPRGLIWDGPSGTSPGALYVMHPPTLSAFTDTDGDGAADRQETIVSGLGFGLDFRGADHTTNGCRLGIDGFIYIAVGDYGFTKAVAKDGTTLSMRGGGIVRVRPDGTGFEIVSRGQRNIYDVAISPMLDLFTRDNTNDGGGWNVRLSFVPPGAEMGYPTLFKNFPKEIIQPLADYGGGSPCGALWIDEPGLQNGLYTVEWGANAIFYHPLEQHGAGWKAKQEKWLGISRPTDMDVDAAGRIYITSWEGATFTYNGPDAGYVVRVTKKGAPPLDLPDLATRKADERIGAKELIAQVGSTSATIRQTAQRELIRRIQKSPGNLQGVRADDALDLMEKKAGAGEIGAAYAAYGVFVIGGRGRVESYGIAVENFKKLNPDRRLLEILVFSDPTLDGGNNEVFAAALEDEDPRVRANAITGIRRRARIELAPQIVPLVADPDPIISHLAVSALRELKAAQPCLAAVDAVLPGMAGVPPAAPGVSPGASGRDSGTIRGAREKEVIAAGALRALHGIYTPEVVDGLLVRLGQIRKNGTGTRSNSRGTREPAGGTAAIPGEPVDAGERGEAFDVRRGILNALCRLASQDAPYADPKEWWGTRPDTSGPVYKPVPWSETGRIEAALRTELDAAPEPDAKWLVQRMYLTKVNYPGLIELMLAKAGSDTAARLIAIDGLFRADDSIPAEAAAALKAVATSEQEAPELRAKALRQLQRALTDRRIFEIALDTFSAFAREEPGHPALAAAFQEFTRDGRNLKWLREYSRMGADKNADGAKRALAQTVLVNLATSGLVKGREKEAAASAVQKCWAEPATAASLLAVIARTGTKAYAEEVKARLNDPNNAVAEAALFAFQKLGLDATTGAPAPTIGSMGYDAVFAAVQKGGDPETGKALYLRAGCIACHTITADEPPKGPVLSAAAKIYDRAALTESILKPHAKVAQGFESAWFKTKQGGQIEGFITREGGDSIEVRNIAGQAVTVARAEIAERGQRPQSMMPEGLMNGFAPAELADLLAFLESLKGK